MWGHAAVLVDSQTIRQAASCKFAALKRMHDVQLSQTIDVAAMTIVVL
jgi:hypothetical protein